MSLIYNVFGRQLESDVDLNTVPIEQWRSVSKVTYSVPRASSINTQSPLSEIQKNIVADGTAIPVVYGHAQVGGKPFAIDYSNGSWVVGYLLCMGEISSIQNVWLNGAAAVSGVTVTNHLGEATQTADTALSTAIASYTDDLVITDPPTDIGIAYIVVEFTDAHYDSWPDVLVDLEGMKVWNPSTSTTVYSENPALHLADLISNSVYGMGLSVDNTDLIAAQDYCDELAPPTTGETRRKSYAVLNNAQETAQWVDILKVYASCFVVYRGSTVHVVPDKTAASAMTITASDIDSDSLRITKKDSSDIPTVIRAWYTDDSGNEWRERLCDPVKAAGVDAGTTQWRESRIRLTGIKRHSQAVRECIERRLKLSLSDLDVKWVQFDEAMELEQGDIVTVTHPYGLTAKLLRLVDAPRQISPGRWAMHGMEYDPAAYSNDITAESTYPDGTLPTSIVPGTPGTPTITEVLYQLNNDEYASRLDIVWTAPSASSVTGYNVTVKDAGANVVWSINTTDLETSTGPLLEGVTYTVYVKAYNSAGTGSASSDTELIDGKTGAPAAPTGLTGVNHDGDVRLSWTASADIDVRRYEVRYYLTTEVWADGVVLDDELSATTFTTRSLASGQWRFGVKAIDSVGEPSATAAEVDVFAGTYTIQSLSFTAVSGNRYPIDTTSNAVTMTLPLAPSAGDIVYFFDYAESWHLNTFTIGRNSEKIMGLTEDMIADVIYFSGTLLYVDSTEGWLLA